MPYRTTTERPSEPPPPKEPAASAWCTRCDEAVASAEERCPRCLRRSSVVASRGAARLLPKVEDRAAPLVWPYTSTCPICTTRAVDESVVYLRIAKVASGAGSVTASIMARVRCCADCQRRVARLEWFRYGGAVLFLAGLVGLVFAMVPGWTRPLGALGGVIAVATLVLLTRANRALRKGLDDAGICDQLAVEVPTPSGGIFEWENRVLHARVAADRVVVDVPEALGLVRAAATR